MKRFCTVLVVTTSLICAATAAWSAPLAGLENNPVTRALFGTGPGSKLLGRIVGADIREVTDQVYASFLNRMRWKQNKSLRAELTARVDEAAASFRAYRTSQGRSAELQATEALLPDEIAFLERAATGLETSHLDGLLRQSHEVINGRNGSYAETRARFLNQPPVEVPSSIGASTIDVAQKLRDYPNFLKTLMLTEGEWKTLFKMSGKAFTPADLRMVQKVTRLLGSLNENSRTRLMIRAVTNERPFLYTELNERTVEATARFTNGEISIDEYIGARSQVAKELSLNEIVSEAERRMLTAIERTKILGGGDYAGQTLPSAIERAEANIAAYGENIARCARAQAKAEKELAEATSPASIDEAKRVIAIERSDQRLWTERRKVEMENRDRLYVEFVQHYESISLFANLRIGRINSEQVQALDMADPFTVSAQEMEAWGELYERALAGSTTELMGSELKTLISAKAGQTRKFINEMNGLTEKFFGKKFTDSQYGLEFRQYTEKLIFVALKRTAGLVGLSVPPAVATLYGDKLWEKLFGEAAPQR